MSMTLRLEAALILGAAALLTPACDDADGEGGEGSLAIRISGEEAAKSGFPVGSGEDEIAFSDGWRVEFEKVLVSLGELELKTAAGDDAEVDDDPIIADLHQDDLEVWKFDAVPAQRWDRVSYRYQPPTSESRKLDAVSDEDVELMQDEEYSLYITGSAFQGDRKVDFAWGFPFVVQLSRCENALDGTDGLVVRDGASNSAEITVHLDHLFFDSWVDEEPKLRFDAMAAVAPEDGPLTLDDLAKQDNLSDMKDADGEPLDLAYDPGSAFSPVPKNLKEYVIDAATTTGHWNGEGHCDYERE